MTELVSQTKREIHLTAWLVVIGFVLLIAAPFLSGATDKMDLSAMLSFPSTNHWLGTDSMGRDLAARFEQVLVDTVFVLWFWAALATLVGILVGISMIALQEQTWGPVIQPIADGILVALSSTPLTVAVFVLAAMNADHLGLSQIITCLFVLLIVHSAQKIRLLNQRDRGLTFWQAHRAMGGTTVWRVVSYGVMGQWRRDMVGLLVFHLKIVLVVEASLSYLSLGVQEPQPSFGNILAAHFEHGLRGQNYWIIVVTAVIFAVTLALPDAMRILIRSRLAK